MEGTIGIFVASVEGGKRWPPPLRWISGPAATGYPWLVSFDQERKGVYDFYDPASDLSYHMSSTESASYPVIFASFNGWLLLSQGPQSAFMLEPFTKTRIDLPEMPQQFNLVGGHFFAVDPTSREYLVGKIYSHSLEKLVILELGSEMTSCACFSVDDEPFTPSRNNLICGRRHVFGLDQNGRLGRLQIFGNPRHWHVLNESQQSCFPSGVSEKSFLVASNRALMSVFVGNSAEWVEVFEFNFSSREWEQVDSLPGNLVLFVGQTSIAVEAEEERMRNKIFFPIFKEADGSIMFYSLETRRFRSFSSEDSYSSLDLHGFRELSNCTWIRPRLVPEKILFTEPYVNKLFATKRKGFVMLDMVGLVPKPPQRKLIAMFVIFQIASDPYKQKIRIPDTYLMDDEVNCSFIRGGGAEMTSKIRGQV
ncbi:hypothetical protein RHMOL_Rhmol11G0244000 [Rhododendron molle]|uniref:Uncharacterized protein n=1 Tax=Rhododendron molle TaxID=49168 RepID=A0ACC0LVI0_RHOML|nr:hypothetical protein RHMOL_Rhmol11G0244000 [Rhododendron molle]